jgi:oligopeptide/dipeptide ABC transporter ATP-binding protein
MAAGEHLLDVQNLRVQFNTRRGVVTAVHDISFTIDPGETLCLIGESGSGKSVTGLAVTGLLPPQRMLSGSVIFDGRNLLELGDAQMRRVRGKEIAMVFQDAMSALDPVYTIGDQIVETLRAHENIGHRAAWDAAVDMLGMVGIPDPKHRMHTYPHELSGGMKQRAVIAIALICQPRLLIADEPTTALDVTIQAQIVELLRSLQSQMGMALLFVTHDLGVVAEIADKVVVVYGGRVVESANSAVIYDSPKMPYTRALIDLAPHVDRPRASKRLPTIPGSVPDPSIYFPGCSFAPRCSEARPECGFEVPALELAADRHLVRCMRWRELPIHQRPAIGV